MIQPHADEILKMICDEFKYKDEDKDKDKGFVLDLNLNDPNCAKVSEDDFKKKYLKKCTEWCIKSNGSKTYKYVYVSILEDGVVAVVGKTTFHCTSENNGTETKIYGNNDLFNAYKGKELTAQLIAAHYKIKIKDADDIQQVNMKVKKAIIIPVNIAGLDTKTCEVRTKELEREIGNFLVSEQIFILNGASHLH